MSTPFCRCTSAFATWRVQRLAAPFGPLFALLLCLSAPPAGAQSEPPAATPPQKPAAAAPGPIARVNDGDAALVCAQIDAERALMERTISEAKAARGNAQATGTAAGVGSTVGGLAARAFGSIGALAGSLGAAAAQGQSNQAASQHEQRAAQAGARRDFLSELFSARGCRADDLAFEGNPVDLAKLAAASAPASEGLRMRTVTPEALARAIDAPLAPIENAADIMAGKANMPAKRVFISEFRVLFEIGGEVRAQNRGGYMPGGIDYGNASVRVDYSLSNVEQDLMQRLVDRAHADFVERAKAAGVTFASREDIVREFGAIYEWTDATRPAQPVVQTVNNRRYLVFAPTGQQVHTRGFAGVGAGNISNRINWSRAAVDALMVNYTVNIGEQQSSGNRSAIFNRTVTASVNPALELAQSMLQSNVGHMYIGSSKPVVLPGEFAAVEVMKESDSWKDPTGAALARLQNVLGQGADRRKSMVVALVADPLAFSELVLKALATGNAAVVAALKRAGM